MHVAKKEVNSRTFDRKDLHQLQNWLCMYNNGSMVAYILGHPHSNLYFIVCLAMYTYFHQLLDYTIVDH